MESFESSYSYVCNVRFPEYTGVRVMMMPFWPSNPHESLPDNLKQYANMLRFMRGTVPDLAVGYLTVDEAMVYEGETHRRPGLHVDGVGEDGDVGGGGYGGGGGYASRGMYVASTHPGCRAWDGVFQGAPGKDGDCEHLRSQLRGPGELMAKFGVYWCGNLAVHESIPMPKDCFRQFVRVSMPSIAPWHDGYTENPLGIKPAGPIKGRRPGMEYRP
jgi:hypothetical protein